MLWAYAVKHHRKLRVKREPRYWGWRKIHTEHYWAYFAYDLTPPNEQCPRCKGSGGEVVDCYVCDGRGHATPTEIAMYFATERQHHVE